MFEQDMKPKRKGMPKIGQIRRNMKPAVVLCILAILMVLVGMIPDSATSKPLACSTNAPIIHAIYGCGAIDNINGDWVGWLYQPEGGAETKYPFVMHIEQSGTRITGTTKIQDRSLDYYGEMDMMGNFEEGEFIFAETNITNELRYPNYRWCVKYGTLKLTEGVLVGSWDAEGCHGGTIKLERAK